MQMQSNHLTRRSRTLPLTGGNGDCFCCCCCYCSFSIIIFYVKSKRSNENEASHEFIVIIYFIIMYYRRRRQWTKKKKQQHNDVHLFEIRCRYNIFFFACVFVLFCSISNVDDGREKKKQYFHQNFSWVDCKRVYEFLYNKLCICSDAAMIFQINRMVSTLLYALVLARSQNMMNDIADNAYMYWTYFRQKLCFSS